MQDQRLVERAGVAAFRIDDLILLDRQLPCGLQDQAVAFAAGVPAGGLVVRVLFGQALAGDDRRADLRRHGRVELLDPSQPGCTELGAARTITLLIPPLRVRAFLPEAADIGGLTLGPFTDLVASHLLSLAEHARRSSNPLATGLARSTMELLGAAVRANSAEAWNAGCAREALVSKALAMIGKSLGDSRLGPEWLARQLGVSRTRLYEAFSVEGGVAAVIRDVRLQAVRAALLDPEDHRRISALAIAHGFKSDAHLSRAFRKLFGDSPSSLRARRRGEQDVSASVALKIKQSDSRVM